MPETLDTHLLKDILPGIFEHLFGDYFFSLSKIYNQPSVSLSKDRFVYN
jgi:hypothetical protein